MVATNSYARTTNSRRGNIHNEQTQDPNTENPQASRRPLGQFEEKLHDGAADVEPSEM